MFVFGLLLFISCCTLGIVSESKVSENLLVNNWKCVNQDCSEPISEGKTIIPYPTSDHKTKLTFKAGEAVSILRKPAENEDQSLWWVEINGKEGYASKRFILEQKILRNKFINVKDNVFKNKFPTISPSAPQVVEGTTLYQPDILHTYDHSQPSSDSVSPNSGTEFKENVHPQVKENSNLDKTTLESIATKIDTKLMPDMSDTSLKGQSDESMTNNTPRVQDVENNVTSVQLELKSEVTSESQNSEILPEPSARIDNPTFKEIQTEMLDSGETSDNDRTDKLSNGTLENNFTQTSNDDTHSESLSVINSSISGQFDDSNITNSLIEKVITQVLDTSQKNQSDESVANNTTSAQQKLKTTIPESSMEKENPTPNETGADIIDQLSHTTTNDSSVKFSNGTVERNFTLVNELTKSLTANNTSHREQNNKQLNESPIEPGSDHSAPPMEPGSDHSAPPMKPGSDHSAPPMEPSSDHSAPPIEPGSAHSAPPMEPGSAHSAPPMEPGSDHSAPPMEPGPDHSAPPMEPGSDHSAPDLQSSAIPPTKQTSFEVNKLHSQFPEIKAHLDSGKVVPMEQVVTAGSDNYQDQLQSVSEKLNSGRTPNSEKAGRTIEREGKNERENEEEVPPTDEVNNDSDSTGISKSESGNTAITSSNVSGESAVESLRSEDEVNLAYTAHEELDSVTTEDGENGMTSETTTKSSFTDESSDQSVPIPPESQNIERDEEDINNVLEDDRTKDTSFLEANENVAQELGNENYEDSSMQWFSSVYSFMESVRELYRSSFSKDVVSEPDSPSSQINEPQQNVLMKQCDQEDGAKPNECFENKPSDDSHILHEDNLGQFDNSKPDESSKDGIGIWSSFKSILWLVGSSIVVLCFSLGYYYLENLKRDAELVEKNNKLSSQLFIIEREKAVLEEELITLKEITTSLTDGKKIMEDELLVVKNDLHKAKEEKLNLEDKETKLLKKLMMVEQNYNELRRIFSESKQKGERSTLISDIKKLKESIAADTVEISSLKEELQEKKNEVKSLNSSLQKSNETKLALQEKMDKMVIEGQEIAKEYQETLAKMEQTIEENKLVQSKLEEDLRNHKKDCESLFIEKELAESTLQKAHGLTSAESLAEWLEVKEIRTSLISAEKNTSNLSKEKDQLLLRLESAEEKGRSLATEVLQLHEKYEKAEKEKIEALTKLQVLSNYFKEKEIQLQEELGMKEAQWLQKQSDDNTIYQQMRDLREENLNLKSLIETLKKEIMDQEGTYKKIINTTEQKAHENWVSFRRTEIRLKEVQAEAAQLRNRLTLETCDDGAEDKLNKTGGLEVNGDLPPIGSAMSPPFMLYPNEFIPPPPLLPPPAGGNPSSRPPPLGRISSPPLVPGEFIPPPPLVPPYELYPHVHGTPPSPPIPSSVIHKPQPREQHLNQTPLMQASSSRKQKDSQSSNHSSESPLDKTPARRSKR